MKSKRKKSLEEEKKSLKHLFFLLFIFVVVVNVSSFDSWRVGQPIRRWKVHMCSLMSAFSGLFIQLVLTVFHECWFPATGHNFSLIPFVYETTSYVVKTKKVLLILFSGLSLTQLIASTKRNKGSLRPDPLRAVGAFWHFVFIKKKIPFGSFAPNAKFFILLVETNK